ncbi:36203_t:CDS:2, partial [Gigaspora margarita]
LRLTGTRAVHILVNSNSNPKSSVLVYFNSYEGFLEKREPIQWLDQTNKNNWSRIKANKLIAENQKRLLYNTNINIGQY